MIFLCARGGTMRKPIKIIACVIACLLFCYFLAKRFNHPLPPVYFEGDTIDYVEAGSKEWQVATTRALAARREQLKNTAPDDPAYSSLQKIIKHHEDDLRKYNREENAK